MVLENSFRIDAPDITRTAVISMKIVLLISIFQPIMAQAFYFGQPDSKLFLSSLLPLSMRSFPLWLTVICVVLNLCIFYGSWCFVVFFFSTLSIYVNGLNFLMDELK